MPVLPKEMLAGENTKEDFQRPEPFTRALFDSIDEDYRDIEERMRFTVESEASQVRDRLNKDGIDINVPDGIRQTDFTPRFDILGKPVPTEASLPRLATVAGRGLVSGATLNLIDMPDLPDESTGERALRGIANFIGATIPFGTGLKVAQALKLSALGRAGVGAGLALTEERLRRRGEDGESHFARDIFAAGITGAFFALAGPGKAIEELQAAFMAREPSGIVAQYRRLPKATGRFAEGKDLPRNTIDFFAGTNMKYAKSLMNDEERELMKMFQQFHKNIPPGLIDFNDLRRMAKDIRAGKRVLDVTVAPIDTPGLAQILKGAGLNDRELRDLFSVEGFAERFGAVGRAPGSFKTGPFNRIVDVVKPTPTATAAASEGATIHPTVDVGSSATDKINEAHARMRAAAEEQINRASEFRNTSGGASNPLPGTVTLQTGRRAGEVITEGEALARRGRPGRAAKDTDVFLRAEDVSSAGQHRYSVRYTNKQGEEVGRSVLVKLKPEAGGLRPIGADDVLPATTRDAQFLIETFSPAPGYSEAIIMDLRRRGAGLLKFDRPTIRGLGRRLGGKQITDDVLELENLGNKGLPKKARTVSGGAPSDDVLSVNELLQGTKPKKRKLPRGAAVSGIKPRNHMMSDIEEAYRPAPDQPSKLPVRSLVFDPIEEARQMAGKESFQWDEIATSPQVLGKHISRAKRHDMMDYLVGTPQQRLAAESRLSADDIRKVHALKEKVLDPLAMREFGTNTDEFFNKIIPRMRAANNPEAREVFGGDEIISRGPGSLLRFMNQNNSINPLEKDIARFTASYIRTIHHRKYLDGPIKAAESMVNSPSFPEQLRPFMRTYIRGIDGTEGRFVDRFGHAYKEMYRLAGIDVSEHEARNIVSGVSALQHAALIGGKPASLIRNITAGPTISGGRIGIKWYLKGQLQSYTKEGRELFRATGIAQEPATILDGLNNLAGAPISGSLRKIANVVLQPYSTVDQWPRANAFLGMRLKVLNAAKKLGRNAPEKEVLRKAGMYRFHPVYHRPFMDKWRAGQFEEVAREAGIIAQQDTQWIYRQGFRPQFLASETGKLFGTFGIWPSNYFEYLNQMRKVASGYWPGVPKSEGVLWMAEWALANAMVVGSFGTAGALVGLGPEAMQNALGWTFIGPAGYNGGPNFDLLLSLPGMITELQRGAPGQMTSEVLGTLDAFVPGLAMLNDYKKSLGKGQVSVGHLQTKKGGLVREPSTLRPRTFEEGAFRFLTGVQRQKNPKGFFTGR